MNSYYGQPPQREENNNLGIAVGALGAGALAGFGGRALLKNINARRAKAQATGGPRGGQGGAITRNNPTAQEYARQQASSQPIQVVVEDLGTTTSAPVSRTSTPTASRPAPQLQSREQAVYGRAANKYPDPGAGKDVQYRFPGGGTDQSMLITDEATGQIFRRGGGLSELEMKAGISEKPVVKTAAYEEGSAVDKLMKSLLPEVNKEAGQMTATESSRQTRALAKQDDQATQAMARGILSELKENQPVGEQLRSKGLAMAGMPGEGPLQIDDGMRLINVDSPAGAEILSNAGVTPEQATSYWSNKLKREGITAEQPATLVQVQESREPLVAVNSMETVNTADDQSDGRFLRNLQRNEDVNMASVSEAVVDNKEAILDSRVKDALSYLRGKEIDTNFDYSTEEARQARQVSQRFERAQALQSLGNQVIEEVQAGTPTTTSAQRFFTNERDEIASLLGEQGMSMSPQNVEKELALRLGSEAYKYGPKYTQRKQALQLGATYDPALFDNMAKRSVVIAGENIPTGRVPETKISKTSMLGTPFEETVERGLREPTYMKETAERLQEKADKKRDWLGSVRLEVANKNAASNAELSNAYRDLDTTIAYRDELENYLDSGRGSLSERTRAKQRLDDTSYEIDRLDTKAAALAQQVYGGQGGSRVRGAQEYTANYIQNLVPPSKLKSGIEEGQRLFYELNPQTGEPIQGTQELRSERKMVDMTPKGGGGRNIAEFSAGNRDEGGGDIDVEDILRQARTPSNQSGREYTKDQFGYRPGTGLTGKPLEGRPFADDRTQTGRVITRTGIQSTKPQSSSYLDNKALDSVAGLSDEQLGELSMMGTEAEAYNADKMLAKRRSFDVAQDIRRIQNSGRPDAQKQVKSYLDELMANEIPGVDFS